MIEQSTNLLGAMFAVWNDRVGNGISQQDVHIRTFPAMQVMSENFGKEKTQETYRLKPSKRGAGQHRKHRA